MRRLPVYLLLDTSGSMSGEPIEAVKNGVQVMISSLRQNPQAIETAFISVITFDSTARQAVPLTDLSSFQVPDIRASGTTAMGEALQLLASCIDREVAQTTTERKGDWKPLVFIMTDGIPTDNWQSGLAAYKQRKTAYTVACAAGNGADSAVLKQVTDNVVRLDTADSHSISKFFAWVTASIGVSSTKIEHSGKELTGLDELPPPPAELNIVV
ncbi:vWA domain-containing protein [Chitinophaga eiseniae]|uniref:VWA domain-containing protein n=1 Tax=Chitinophaga eiseniae TaxID=634771 RepID=A0A847SBD4_9BACT|nr:VWA domain-containing protein [Chitinophaga eiseniae]NLR77424.1 VWA domain-containing protein [Chitinophaga eiseniae]